MITADEARALIAAKEDVAQVLSEINDSIAAACDHKLTYLEYSIENDTMVMALTCLISNKGYEVKYESHRRILKIRW